MDYGQAVWRECARTRDYSFNTGPCQCWKCIPMPLPAAASKPKKKGLMDKLMSCIMCQCIFDPVPPPPPNTHLTCVMDTQMPNGGCSAGAAVGGRPVPTIGCGMAGSGGVSAAYMDPEVAKQHLKETVRLAQVNEKVYGARVAAAASRAKEVAKEQEKEKKEKEKKEKAEKKAKDKAAKDKAAAEEKAKREAAKFEAWARRNGCTTATVTPSTAALVPAPACATSAHTPLLVMPPHAHVAIGYLPPRNYTTDVYGTQWPLMSNAMMHAVQSQNREDVLLGLANGAYCLR